MALNEQQLEAAVATLNEVNVLISDIVANILPDVSFVIRRHDTDINGTPLFPETPTNLALESLNLLKAQINAKALAIAAATA